MLKTISIYIFFTIMLSACSLNQNYILNTTNNDNTKSILETQVVHETVSSAAAVSVMSVKPKSKTIVISKCLPAKVSIINKPAFNEKKIMAAKTQRDMVQHLITHIENLDKIIYKANININNINSTNSKICN